MRAIFLILTIACFACALAMIPYMHGPGSIVANGNIGLSLLLGISFGFQLGGAALAACGFVESEPGFAFKSTALLVWQVLVVGRDPNGPPGPVGILAIVAGPLVLVLVLFHMIATF